MKDWIWTIVAPSDYRELLLPHVSDELAGKVHYLENDCVDIWAWSEKVYEFVKSL